MCILVFVCMHHSRYNTCTISRFAIAFEGIAFAFAAVPASWKPIAIQAEPQLLVCCHQKCKGKKVNSCQKHTAVNVNVIKCMLSDINA